MKVFKCVVLFIVFMVTSAVLAQNVKTNVNVGVVIAEFEKQNIHWAVPISQTKTEDLQWYKRSNSLEKTENIRTFVAYKKQNMVGVISIFQKKISGNVTIDNEKIRLETSEDGFLIISKLSKENNSRCGSCANPNHSHKSHFLSQFSAMEESPSENHITQRGYKIPSDGVLRVYRLAMLVTNKYFTDQNRDVKFNRSIEKVKTFWAETETFLNEMYPRDVSVRFEIVNDEKLIYKNPDQFQNEYNGYRVYNQGTRLINELIGEENYDVGLIIYNTGGNLDGLGDTGGVYDKSRKAHCFAKADYSTIAHEVGHLYGSLHTFSNQNLQTYFSEPSSGLSVMSYGFGSLRDYFSLVSIGVIRERLQRTGYYTDKQRTQLVKGARNDSDSNIPYGIKNPNTPPVINTFKIKKEYRLPQNTYFQFYIPAVDNEQTQLNYYAHQVGDGYFPNFRQGSAKFISTKPTQTGYVVFEKTYGQNFAIVPNSEPKGTGIFDFWLAVNDANLKDEQHGVYYDETFTRVNIVSGTPFKITEGYKKQYTAGEKVTFRWSVDNQIFDPNSKVRILLSDDFGKTYKFILAPSVPNNGEAQITIPYISLGQKKHQFGQHGLGIIKIEVIEHIAHAITENNILNGGFEIQEATITFDNTPEPTISVKEGSVPDKADVTATSTCSGSVNIVYNEQETESLITRTWTATDNCGKTATFTQHIYVQKNQPLEFVEKLPEDLTIEYGTDEVPESIRLTARGGCQTPEVKFSETKLEGVCSTLITRIWTATSSCSDPISHTQTIRIVDNSPPNVIGSLPEDKVVRNESEIQPETISVIDQTSKDKRNEGNPFDAERFEERITDQNGELTKVIYKWRANDFCGNLFEHTQTISVVSSEQKPIKFTNFPDNQELTCGSSVPTGVTSLSVSGCDETPNVSVTHRDIERGDCRTGRTIERTYTGSACGQTISQTQIITISGDNLAPTFNEELPQNEQVTRNNIPIEQRNLTATDNCSTNVSVEKTRSEENNIITETWTARDDCGNEATHRRTITIIQSELDFVNPPQDLKLSCANEIPTASTLTASGNCNPKVAYQGEVRENETCANSFALVRTWRATDDCGNQKEYRQRIVVSDTQVPEFQGELPIDVSVRENEIPAKQSLRATDNCSSEMNVEPQRARNGNIITETWTARDDCGNEATHRRTITIIQSELEFVNPPQDLNLSCANEIPTAPTLTASGNCNPQVAYQGEVRENETCANSFTLVRTWRATDDCGNQKEYRHRIVVSDTQVPEFQGELPIDVSVRENEIPAKQSLRATDNCSSEMNIEPQRERNGNIITETWTARDDCGNEATHTRRITILPEPPTPTPIPQPEPNPIDPKPAPKSDEIVVNNWVSQWVGNHFLRIENIEGKEANVKIFNELGQLVFEISGYDNRERVFIGDRNIGGNDKLSSGVYFYILEYKKGGVKHRKTGFLVLKN